MTGRLTAGLLGAVALAVWLVADPPSASAAPCPDVEVTFARATTEPPGIGSVGQAFVDSLRSQVRGRSVGVYAVDYPATEDFARSASAGAANQRTRAIRGRELSGHQIGPRWLLPGRDRH